MRLIVQHTEAISGQIRVPGSKSHSIRAIFLASLSQGQSTLHHVLRSEDTFDAIRACRLLGAMLRWDQDVLVIDGIGKEDGLKIQSRDGMFFSGNSGITTRFLLPLLGLRQNFQQVVTLDCGGQMRARPMGTLVDALVQLGLSIEYLDKPGFCPVAVSGTLQAGKIRMQGASSQNVSALLMALACVQGNSQITVENLCSRPYVDMTLKWLETQGIAYLHHCYENLDVFTIWGRQPYVNFLSSITGDFSSASYLIAAGVLIPGGIQLHGLSMQDEQGDKALVTILQAMGANIGLDSNGITLHGGQILNGITIDACDIPDLLPMLAVIGTQAQGQTDIINIKHARTKETDRIHSMVQGLRRLGARVDEREDGITVHRSELIGAEVEGFGDHRTVMALTVAGMLASGATFIEDGEAVHKTFPEFIQAMQSIGAELELEAEILTC